jgi:hypothetical protein
MKRSLNSEHTNIFKKLQEGGNAPKSAVMFPCFYGKKVEHFSNFTTRQSISLPKRQMFEFKLILIDEFNKMVSEHRYVNANHVTCFNQLL